MLPGRHLNQRTIERGLLCALFLALAAGMALLLFPPLQAASAEVLPQETAEPPGMQVGEPAGGSEGKSWLILPTMPPGSTQADYGAEIYRLVCKSCHGDVGRGLTAEWIAQWNPADQNCWQSKCHAANHPQDGFEIPHYVPPVMGEGALLRFDTALDLYEYLRSSMPWQDPGSLLDSEYWQLTAYLLEANNITPPVVLAEDTADDVPINYKEPSESQGGPAGQAQNPGIPAGVESGSRWLWYAAPLAVLAAAGLVLLWRARLQGSVKSGSGEGSPSEKDGEPRDLDQ